MKNCKGCDIRFEPRVPGMGYCKSCDELHVLQNRAFWVIGGIALLFMGAALMSGCKPEPATQQFRIIHSWDDYQNFVEKNREP